MRLVVFGGGGKIARHVARLAGAGNEVVSVVRNDKHDADLKSLGATPVLLSLEDVGVEEITALLKERRADAVLFAAGAGGGSTEERTRRVDYQGCVDVYEACAKANVPRLVLISAMDLRDRSKPPPAYYNDASKKASDAVWGAIGYYMQIKLDAERALHKTSLDYTVLRPGRLMEDPAAGAQVGITQLTHTSRELVAQAVWGVLAEPKTAGLTLDVVDGEGDLKAEIAKCAQDRTDAYIP